MSAIHGIGIDLVEIQRLKAALGRQGDAFLKRILNADELLVYQQRCMSSAERGLRFLATRFAAKEAFSKAMGTGIGGMVGFHSISVLNNEKGMPYIELKEDINAITGFNITQIFVSLSDESHYAIAQIIIEKQL